MIPVTLKIAGFLSYAEPVEVDFTEFELACISGQNGAGKSSLLDAITWALFGIARKRDDSIINTRKKTAEVAFQFEHEGNLYRIIRSRTEEKPHSGILVKAAEGWSRLPKPPCRAPKSVSARHCGWIMRPLPMHPFSLQGKADQFAQQVPTDRSASWATSWPGDLGRVPRPGSRKAQRPGNGTECRHRAGG